MKILWSIGGGMIALGSLACLLIVIASIWGSSLFDTAESAVTFWSLFASCFLGGVILCGIDSEPMAIWVLKSAGFVLLSSALLAVAIIMAAAARIITVYNSGALWALFILGVPTGAAVILLARAKEAGPEASSNLDRDGS